MAMLLRRLKQRLREGGRKGGFQCIATSATLAEGPSNAPAVAKFATSLFGEEFTGAGVIMGEEEPLPVPGEATLSLADYRSLMEGFQRSSPGKAISALAARLGLTTTDAENETCLGLILQRDCRAAKLRNLLTAGPRDIKALAGQLFDDEITEKERVAGLCLLVSLMNQAKESGTGAPLLPVRYHLFLRSLEGAFVSCWPQKQVFLDRASTGGEHPAFEVALCRECGQHYFVGQRDSGASRLVEAIRDPGEDKFGATFFRPLEEDKEPTASMEDTKDRDVWLLCIQCGALGKDSLPCGHGHTIRVVKEKPPADDDRADQLSGCGACGYNASGRDPVREVVHGTDGPHAVIATCPFGKGV